MRIALALVVCLFAAAFGAVGVEAGQDDKRLPALFDRLKTTRAPGEAETVQQTIWAVWLESTNAEVNLLMLEGIDAMNGGDFKRALTAFDAMVGVDPKFAEGWNKRATVEFLAGDFKASVVDIQKTLELEPRHWGALAGLGQIYTALGDEEAAVRAFKRALAINPHLASVKAKVQELEAKLEKRKI
ncbi:MAG: tetratricopeptide repeat protein [Proteobacteria bacterium]|nr:tetratricopeptide repeat protein [Pseudomonadota bacterium]